MEKWWQIVRPNCHDVQLIKTLHHENLLVATVFLYSTQQMVPYGSVIEQVFY
jgi:hypothetical protein